MNKLRQILTNIKAQLGGMGATQKLLIGSLAIIALMSLFLVSQYAARPALVDLMADDPNISLVENLRGRGVNAKVVDGRLMVPPGQRRSAIAQLADQGQLPGDTTVLFNNLMEHQDWKNSRQQNRQQYDLAMQNELSRIIGKMPSIAKAYVMIDNPESGGLGRAAKSPTASVTVFTSDGGGIPQPTVDAIARLVAGPVSGMRPTAVSVIDGTSGRPRTVTNSDDIAATNYLEKTQKTELAIEAKLHKLLSHIPGVVVSVAASVDVTRISTSRRSHLTENEGSVKLIKSTRENETTQTNRTAAAEPGVRSNAQADINNAGGSSGTNNEQAEGEREYDTAIGQEVTEKIDPRGMPTFLSASVNIPQTYIEGLIRSSRIRNATDDNQDELNKPITEGELDQRFESIRPALQKSIENQLVAIGPDGSRQQGEAVISMVPIIALAPNTVNAGGLFGTMMASGGGAAGGGGSGGFVSAMRDGLLETILVAVLALVALFMMFMMIRRAGKHIELPTPEEFVGIPPKLNTHDDMVGEADESEMPLEAIEIDEASVVRQKMLEQVGDLVKAEPTLATRLIERWIGMEG